MKAQKPNAELVWKQIEDLLAPRLRLSITDRVVYSHLLRHTRLEGKQRLRFSMTWLSRSVGLCSNSARWAVRRLSDAELADRLRALDTLAAGKLRPLSAAKANPLPRPRRPRLLPVAS